MNDHELDNWIDDVADKFEAAWQGLAPPELEPLLEGMSGERRDRLRDELLKLDRQYRERLAQAVPSADTPPLPDTAAGPTAEASHAPNFPTVPGYEILSELGQGGMGVVYKARQLGLNRLVALKIVRAADFAGDPELSRFRAEAEAAARLQHANIVQIYDVGEWHPTSGGSALPYFAMEFVDGPTLDKHTAGKPQPARAAAELIETLAQAIHHAHQHGIVHRDLKPANILLQELNHRGTEDTEKTERKNRQGRNDDPSHSASSSLCPLCLCGDSLTPKIADFGLAKRLDASSLVTQTGHILGSPNYMAPEQAEGKTKTIGPAADIYALGAILYELVTGRPPFQGATTLETLQMVSSQEPVSPTQLVPKLPRDLATICLKCLAKEAERRYANALELADDLRRFLDGKPIRARAVGRVEKTWRWCRRKPAVAGLMAAVGIIFVGGIIGLLLWLRAENQHLIAAHQTQVARLERQNAEKERAMAQRRSLMAEAQRIRLTSKQQGRRKQLWDLYTKAAKIHSDLELRNEAAAALAGLEAQPMGFVSGETHFAAFSENGEDLLRSREIIIWSS